MHPKTRSYLALAERNRELAKELMILGTNTSLYGWVTVIAFYAAVHYVNDYLYEKQGQYEVTTQGGHGDRNAKVVTHLPSAVPAYFRLSSLAHDARYTPSRSIIYQATAHDAIRDLLDVEAIVLNAIR